MRMKGTLLDPRNPARWRDLGVYILVTLIFVSVIVVAAMKRVPEQKFFAWLEFVCLTLFLFGQFILKSKRVWKRRSFWFVTGTFFLVHVITLAKVLHAGRQISGGAWLLLVIAEMAVLMVFRKSTYGA
jgi:hypothetical protein